MIEKQLEKIRNLCGVKLYICCFVSCALCLFFIYSGICGVFVVIVAIFTGAVVPKLSAYLGLIVFFILSIYSVRLGEYILENIYLPLGYKILG